MSTDLNTDHDFDPAILDKLKQLQEKYAAMGQDLSSYLDGLLYADYRTYWDLIHLDTLLSLCLLYTSPSPRDYAASRMPSSA